MLARVTCQDPFWKYCQERWDDVLPAGDLSQYPATAVTLAQEFLQTDDVRCFLGKIRMGQG